MDRYSINCSLFATFKNSSETSIKKRIDCEAKSEEYITSLAFDPQFAQKYLGLSREDIFKELEPYLENINMYDSSEVVVEDEDYECIDTGVMIFRIVKYNNDGLDEHIFSGSEPPGPWE